jgi:pimeloyl-ACP methyl ester carboxylesterase/DNA-binding CsgD family transcriptional regulator
MYSHQLDNDEKADILRALYGAATDTQQHEELTDLLSAAFERDDGASISHWLEPHIENATNIFENLHFAGLLDKTSAGIVESTAGPAAVVDETGNIIAANEKWQAIKSSDKLEHLSASSQDMKSIQRTMRSLHTILEDRTHIIRLEGAIGDYPALTFRRLPSPQTRSNAGSRVLVRAASLDWSPALSEFLQQEFGLTHLEYRTVKMMVAGLELSEIAEKIERTRETVKSRTKSIYAKLEVSGREHLVRMILQLQNLMDMSSGRTEVRSKRPDEQYVLLSDGRRIHWIEKGAKHGRRIVFLHGLSLGYHFSQSFEQWLLENNLTFVCIDRPGYGASDPPKNWKSGLEEWIDLFPELLQKLGLERVPVVTQTGGIMMAAAAAAHHPNLVSGVCAFAAGVPITDARRLAAYPSQVKLISRAARVSPTILRFLIMNAAHYFRTATGRQRMIERTYANGSVDSAALRNPHTYKSVRRSLEMIADGGFDGFVSDNLHMFADWSRYPKSAKCEIAYLNGTEDQICPAAWAEEFASSLPNMNVTELPGAGNLMLHTHGAACGAHLLRCLARFDQT